MERRALLGGLPLEKHGAMVPSSTRGNGAELFRAACAIGAEGLVAKRLGSRYAAGERSADWLKFKNTEVRDLVLGGWMPGPHGGIEVDARLHSDRDDL